MTLTRVPVRVSTRIPPGFNVADARKSRDSGQSRDPEQAHPPGLPRGDAAGGLRLPRRAAWLPAFPSFPPTGCGSVGGGFSGGHALLAVDGPSSPAAAAVAPVVRWSSTALHGHLPPFMPIGRSLRPGGWTTAAAPVNLRSRPGPPRWSLVPHILFAASAFRSFPWDSGGRAQR